MQNIDKIAIGLAVVILVSGFAASALVPDQGGEYSDAIGKANEQIRRNTDEQLVGGDTPPGVEEEVRKAYSFNGETKIPEWSFYRRPARLELFQTEVVLPPELAGGRLSGVEVVRTVAPSPLHRISGRLGTFERAEIVACNIEVSEDSDGTWSKVHSFSDVVSGSSFSVDIDQGLESGKSYSYRIVMRGRSTSSISFASGTDVVTSEASGAVMYPPNSIWKVSGAQIGKLDSAGNFVPGRATIQNTYWDWDAGQTKRNTKIVTEPAAGASGAELFGTGFRLERIQDTADARTVVLKDADGKRMYLKNNEDPPPLVPDNWTNFEEESDDEGEEDDTSASDTETEVKEPAKPARPRPSGGGGLFGGGDD